MPSISLSSGTLSDAVRLDFSPRSRIFGRDNETKILLDALERVSCCSDIPTTSTVDRGKTKKNELVLVMGDSGTGKSSLVKVSLRDATRNVKGGFFVSGKFNQYSSHNAESFSALTEALNDLCRLIDKKDDRENWLKLIEKALGIGGIRYLSLLIPKLGNMFPDRDDQETPCQEEGSSYDRFIELYRKLVEVVSSPSAPVVLFIDDLQWSDSDSMKLIQSLLRSEKIDGLLLVGAYRDDEIDDTHNLSETMKHIDNNRVRIGNVPIGCMTERSVNELIAFATDLQEEQTRHLSQLIHRKTLGNCFFVKQFLEMLQDERLLYFSFQSYRWSWDVEDIQNKTNVSDNVVDLLSTRIDKLDESMQHVFKVAGCLGTHFNLAALDIIVAGMTSAEYKVVEGDQNVTTKDPNGCLNPTTVAIDKLVAMNLVERGREKWLKFSHDRIQQAAEPRVRDEEKLRLYLQIGRILRDHPTTKVLNEGNEHDWMFFVSINQLNKGSKLMTDIGERYETALLNLKAAEKARSRSAFLPAGKYCEEALALLGYAAWEAHTDLALKLYSFAATCYCMCGQGERSFKLAEVVVQRSTTLNDKVSAQHTQLQVLLQQRRFEEGKRLGLAILEVLGEKFPKRLNAAHVVRGLLKTKRCLKNRSDEDLLGLPMMTDETKKAVCRIIKLVEDLLFFSVDKDMIPLLWFRNVKIALKYGMCRDNCIAFIDYSLLLGHLNDVTGAYRYGKLAMEQNRKYGGSNVNVKVHAVYYFATYHWRHPMQGALEPLINSYTYGMNMGDTFNALFASYLYCGVYLLCGLSLEFVENDIRNFVHLMLEYKLQVIADLAIIMWQLLLNLVDDKETSNPLILTGRAMDEFTFCKEIDRTGNSAAKHQFYGAKLRLSIYFGDNEKAFAAYKSLRSDKKEVTGHCGTPQEDFFGGLAAFAVAKSNRLHRGRRLAFRLIRKFEKWVQGGAVNCVHMLLLLKAEAMSFQKNKYTSAVSWREEVRRAYDDAIRSASRSGFGPHAALANERAAAYLNSFDVDYAKSYLRHALIFYIDWGALGKLEQLASVYPFLTSQAKTSTRLRSTSGRMRARSRYKEDVAEQHKQMKFW